jgi:hypothetical protein
MIRPHCVPVAAAIGLAVACGGSATGGGRGSAGGSCSNFFDAVFASDCLGPVPRADELARQRARFIGLCENELALPGQAIAAGQLDACASAFGAGSCRATATTSQACAFGHGALADGAACQTDTQCQSGICKNASPCGMCAPAIPVGQACGGNTGGTCAQGSACQFSAQSAPGGQCVMVSYGNEGASCDGSAARCSGSLYCDLSTHKCTAPGGAGSACQASEACTGQLVCTGAPKSCQVRQPVGSPCQGRDECGPGLVCPGFTHQCSQMTWVSAGQPCSDTALCAVGPCPAGASGPGGAPVGAACPTVIADGKPCNTRDLTTTCDAFASCQNGICTLPGSAVCP